MSTKSAEGSNVANKLVAVVVPISNRTTLTPDEEISLSHLVHFLGQYDKYIVAPEDLVPDYSGFGVKYFDPRFFGSAEAHKKLMLAQTFYETFLEYKYVLIYHLDALVFSDELKYWCETDLDYIGAPFLNDKSSPGAGFDQVGNGGFSLRKVSSFLRVITSPKYKYHKKLMSYWKKLCQLKAHSSRYIPIPRGTLQRAEPLNGTKQKIRNFMRNDDRFWSHEAKNYYREFKVASVEEGLRFAFEMAPRYCFEQNNQNLPFGCHAWPRYDREFWEPYLLKTPMKFQGREQVLNRGRDIIDRHTGQ